MLGKRGSRDRVDGILGELAQVLESKGWELWQVAKLCGQRVEAKAKDALCASGLLLSRVTCRVGHHSK